MKEVEQQLREHVKWLATDSETWLKDLRERIEQLDRISDKSLRLVETSPPLPHPQSPLQ